ncbi:hypothetical protein D3C78_1362480 [compost metagenome]
MDDRIVLGLPMNLRQQIIRLLLGKEAAARNRRQLPGIAEHEDRRAEAHQVLAELLVHHRTFIDDDERRLGERALAVDGEHRRNRGLAGLLVFHGLFAARAVDQRMDGAGIGCTTRTQHLRRLTGEGRKQHLAINIFSEMFGKRRLARSGITEQPENRCAAFLQPAGNSLERFVLLR